ncbi:FecR family protein [Pedobacter punctiformis]|uniref:FecR domain-containing protein n=1 Tax=Pedobacter punctiformis TaxID=3004097 RepID=A0ABT4L5K3_9SPHI|nr:FecR domain-containing protein [Pedobacter sp. HCMS5-2]MCZ4243185.1 FecR domain-containing protein [Pedobacter sp. HCMS5-2]
MQVDQKLIEKFFAGKCSADEACMVSKFLENQEHFEKHWDLEDWNAFKMKEELPEALSKKMNSEIISHIYDQKEARVKRLKYLAYAATIAVVVSVGLFVSLSGNKNTDLNVSTNKQKELIKEVAETIYKNDLAIKRSYTLPDGSIVELEPKSEISFLPFNQKRDIKLRGEALFRVHKDKARPFTVYGNNLATTALGTIFRVSAFANNKYTSVKLLEGKVVVKPQNILLNAGVKMVYLTPGKSFTVNMENYAAVVKDFAKPQETIIAKINKGSVLITESAMIFNNQPLSEVFKALEQKLNISIAYNPKLVNKKTFSGQYEFGRDDADEFLTTLTFINGLTVEKTEKGYVIRTR